MPAQVKPRRFGHQLVDELAPTRSPIVALVALVVETPPNERCSGVDLGDRSAARSDHRPTIDYWVYVDGNERQAQLSVEGWSYRDEVIDLSGDGVRDGIAIGSAMARILRVPPPG